MSRIRKLSQEKIVQISDILGFSEPERNIFAETLGMSKNLNMIARHTGIPRGSLLYTMRNFAKRGLLIASPSPWHVKSTLYRSDIYELVQKLNAIIQSANANIEI